MEINITATDLAGIFQDQADRLREERTWYTQEDIIENARQAELLEDIAQALRKY